MFVRHLIGLSVLLIVTLPAAAGPPARLDAARPSQKELHQFHRLAWGRVAPNPGDEELLDRMARWLVYRLTWREIQDGREALTTNDLVSGFHKALPRIPNLAPPGQQAQQEAFQQTFAGAALPHLREVLKLDQPVAVRINAVRMLNRFIEVSP